jgi:hypothetical protein
MPPKIIISRAAGIQAPGAPPRWVGTTAAPGPELDPETPPEEPHAPRKDSVTAAAATIRSWGRVTKPSTSLRRKSYSPRFLPMGNAAYQQSPC